MFARLRRFLPLLGVVLFALALFALHRQLAGFHYRDFAAALAAMPLASPLSAVGLTALSYLTLTGYDRLAFRYLEQAVPYRQVVLASFVGHAFTNALGPAAGLPLRYRVYSAFRVEADVVVKAMLFGGATYVLGYLTLGSLGFTFWPVPLPATLPGPFLSTSILGGLCALGVALYLLASGTGRRIRVRGWDLPVPSLATAGAQFLLSTADWALMASVVFVLLPPVEGLSWPMFLGLFLLAHLAGLLSQIPGGLGVFDSALALLLAPYLTAAQTVSALLLFRAIYQLLPLAGAASLLAVHEWRFRRQLHRENLAGAVKMARQLADWSTAAAPGVLAVVVFIAGALLVLSGSIPADRAHLAWLGRILPLSLIEASHFLASVVGLTLLLLARGLQQRLRAAYVLTALLLGLGVVLAVSRGGGWGHALPSAVALALLLPCRQDFHRPASLVRERFTVPWSAAVAVVLVAAASLTLFSYRNVEFSSELWWRFALDGDAPRALRALMGGTAVAFLAAVAWLLRTAPPEPDPPTEAELDRAAEIAAVSPRAAAHIALLGDKRLLFNDRQDAFLMYAIEGRSWISVGEAVGAEQEIDELTWRFHSLSLAHGGRPVFYQVPEQGLHRYAELGLTLLKLGEAGRVPLEGFTLEGSARADLRQASRKVERAGCRFAVLPKEAVEPLLPRLRAISDAWLEGKNMPEKGFSLGFFHPAYLMRTPLAVVYRQIEGQVEGQAEGEPPGEEIVAFANILPGGEREECTVDLMRYTPAAPRGVMDYLFAQLMLWGAAEKFRWFSLGMAPLSGLRPETGPLWNRLGHLLFRHGEHFYNFQGLRQYKEKFNPVWSARYLATPGGLALPQILTDLTTLISRVPPEARDR